MRNDFDWDLQDNFPHPWDMNNRFDDPAHNHDVMYESFESRYVTELVNADMITKDGVGFAVEYAGGPFDAGYLDGFGVAYVIVDGKRCALAMQSDNGEWFFGKDVYVGMSGTDNVYMRVASFQKLAANKFYFAIETKVGKDGSYAPADPAAYNFAAIGRYDSEKDLTGKYLGEVELQMRTYNFKPHAIALGVTWTQLAELTLDTSFGVSAEEILMDAAAQEIKKSLDFQAIKMASDAQKTRASENFVQFDAEAGGDTKDSYYHTAQLIGQAIDRIGDLQLNRINRGGVSAIVGGPAAVNYLKLNKLWSDTGKQPAIGGHKVGELDGIPVIKVPSGIIADDELLTVWKNPAQESDVAMAIGTLMPLVSTGILQRKPLYKEAEIARYEDSKVLNALYLGRIKIKNIRSL